MGLIRENTELKAQQYADLKAQGLQQQLGAQAAWNATQEGVIRCQAQQLAQLYTLTQLTIPNRNLNPGYGPADVRPAPPPIPPVTEAAATTTTGTGN